MSPFGEFILSPTAILAWLVVGLGAGWLAGVVMGGSDFGVIVKLGVGLIGGAFGGVIFGMLVGGDVGFWGSLGAAFVGAGILIAVVHFGERQARRRGDPPLEKGRRPGMSGIGWPNDRPRRGQHDQTPEEPWPS